MPRHVLKLYVTGQSPSSQRALDTVHRLLEEAFGKEYELTVIDVLEQPHLAEQDRVLVTPTLIKQVPPPARRVLGDLTDAEGVRRGLQV